MPSVPRLNHNLSLVGDDKRRARTRMVSIGERIPSSNIEGIARSSGRCEGIGHPFERNRRAGVSRRCPRAGRVTAADHAEGRTLGSAGPGSVRRADQRARCCSLEIRRVRGCDKSTRRDEAHARLSVAHAAVLREHTCADLVGDDVGVQLGAHGLDACQRIASTARPEYRAPNIRIFQNRFLSFRRNMTVRSVARPSAGVGRKAIC